MKRMISLGLKHVDERLWVLDQTRLPHQELWISGTTPTEMVEIIQRLAIRGAPLIGVAAALVLARFAEDGATAADWLDAAQRLRAARPTAVNLMSAVDRMIRVRSGGADLVREAEAIFDEDVALCEAMAEHGSALIQDGDSILTHCNTGGLATAGIGTALGVIRRAHEQGKRLHVYVDETRPLFQGARLTAWELQKLGIPYTLICDNMAASLMGQGKVSRIFVGADRIAQNGDAANKIGTYSLAVQAAFHKIPFYVVAPRTTLDEKCATGKDIPIEERAPDEVRGGHSPKFAPVYNPAFDVTPRSLITEVILDSGLMKNVKS
ncbi:MAG TPA: S-methyl-5-thioribose-1-phosphate isomerase [Bdellovibrionota bacterium]|nr:S-methyl-5-thioribose-1-phosphate isomerase [Bdellovibrionota bacterium]